MSFLLKHQFNITFSDEKKEREKDSPDAIISFVESYISPVKCKFFTLHRLQTKESNIM